MEANSKFINRKIERNKLNSAAIYYPNRYNLHYAVARAYSNGAIQLKYAREQLINDIKQNQLPNGAWVSKKIINGGDTIQSTAFALSTLLCAGNFDDLKTTESINGAISFLLKAMSATDDGVFWQGGVFFSGGTVVRKTLYFKSDAYTTALVAQCLYKYIESKKNGLIK